MEGSTSSELIIVMTVIMCENFRKFTLRKNCKIGAVERDKLDKLFIKHSHTSGGLEKNSHTCLKIQDKHTYHVFSHVFLTQPAREYGRNLIFPVDNVTWWCSGSCDHNTACIKEILID